MADQIAISFNGPEESQHPRQNFLSRRKELWRNHDLKYEELFWQHLHDGLPDTVALLFSFYSDERLRSELLNYTNLAATGSQMTPVYRTAIDLLNKEIQNRNLNKSQKL